MLTNLPAEILIKIIGRTTPKDQGRLRLTHPLFPTLVNPFFFEEVNISAGNWIDRICGIGNDSTLQKFPRVIRVVPKHNNGLHSSDDTEREMHNMGGEAAIRPQTYPSEDIDREMQVMFSNMTNATEFICEHPVPQEDLGPIFSAYLRSSVSVTGIELHSISSSILQDLLATKRMSDDSRSALTGLSMELDQSDPEVDRAAFNWLGKTLMEAQELASLHLRVNPNIEFPFPINAITSRSLCTLHLCGISCPASDLMRVVGRSAGCLEAISLSIIELCEGVWVDVYRFLGECHDLNVRYLNIHLFALSDDGGEWQIAEDYETEDGSLRSLMEHFFKRESTFPLNGEVHDWRYDSSMRYVPWWR